MNSTENIGFFPTNVANVMTGHLLMLWKDTHISDKYTSLLCIFLKNCWLYNKITSIYIFISHFTYMLYQNA